MKREENIVCLKGFVRLYKDKKEEEGGGED